MTYSEIISQLQSLGSEQTRKTYARHGITGDVYGVSFANLTKLKKQIKHNHQLAAQLWQSGNFDARCLALMIAEPKQATHKELQQWAAESNNGTLADLFAIFCAKTSHAQDIIQAFMQSEREYDQIIAWGIIFAQAISEQEFEDAYFEEYLAVIRPTLQASKNFIKYAKNKALIGIGSRNLALKQQAQEIARAIGKVVVDHGDTSCKTPDAYEDIERVWSRRKT